MAKGSASMTKGTRQKLLLTVTIFVTLTVAILWRLFSAFIHFGHIDDLGVAITIKDTFATYYGPDMSLPLRLKVEEHFDGLLNLIPASMSDLKSSLVELIVSTYKAFKLFHAIPLVWTYAPLQFYLTTPLVLFSDSFEQVKFFGRLPSLLFGVASIYFYTAAARNWLNAGSSFPTAQRLPALLFSIVLFSMSHQGIIYASQMQSYSIALFYVCLFMYLLSREDFLSSLTRRNIWTQALWSLFLFSALIAQYQMVTAVIALAGTWVYFSWRHEKRHFLLINFTLILSIAVALSLPYLLTFLAPILGAAVTWNAGTQGEYLFHPERFSISVPIDFVRYLFHVTPDILIANLAFISPADPIVPFVKWIFVICFTLGVFTALRNISSRQAHPIEVFSVCLLCVTVILAFAGKIALSPTRHTLLLLPVLALFTTIGVGSLLKPIGGAKAELVITCLALAIAIFSILGIKPFFEARRELVNSEVFLDKIEKYRPNYLAVHDASPSIMLMEELTTTTPLLNLNTDISGGVNKPPEKPLLADGEIAARITLLFYSHKQTLNGDNRLARIRDYAEKYMLKEPVCMNLTTLQSHSTNTEVDWWPYIPNGANGVHIQLAGLYPSSSKNCAQRTEGRVRPRFGIGSVADGNAQLPMTAIH